MFILDVRAEETTPLFLGIQAWLFMSIILIGFIIITFRFILKAVLFHQGQPETEGN